MDDDASHPAAPPLDALPSTRVADMALAAVALEPASELEVDAVDALDARAAEGALAAPAAVLVPPTLLAAGKAAPAAGMFIGVPGMR